MTEPNLEVQQAPAAVQEVSAGAPLEEVPTVQEIQAVSPEVTPEDTTAAATLAPNDEAYLRVQSEKLGGPNEAAPEDVAAQAVPEVENPTKTNPPAEKPFDQWVQEMDEKWPATPEITIGTVVFKNESELAAKLIEIHGIGKITSNFVAAAMFDKQAEDPTQYESAADFRWIRGIGPKRATAIAEAMGLVGIESENPADTEEQIIQDEQDLDATAAAWEGEQVADQPPVETAAQPETGAEPVVAQPVEASLPEESAVEPEGSDARKNLLQRIRETAAQGVVNLASKGQVDLNPYELHPADAVGKSADTKDFELQAEAAPAAEKDVNLKPYELEPEKHNRLDLELSIADSLKDLPEETLLEIKKVIEDAGIKQAEKSPDFQVATGETPAELELSPHDKAIEATTLSPDRKNWLKKIASASEKAADSLKSLNSWPSTRRLKMVVALVSVAAALTLGADQGTPARTVEPVAATPLSGEVLKDSFPPSPIEQPAIAPPHVEPQKDTFGPEDILTKPIPSMVETNQPKHWWQRFTFGSPANPVQPDSDQPQTPQEEQVEKVLDHGYGQYGAEDQRLNDMTAETEVKTPPELEKTEETENSANVVTLEEEDKYVWNYVKEQLTKTVETPNNQQINAVVNLIRWLNFVAFGPSFNLDSVEPGMKMTELNKDHIASNGQLIIALDGSSFGLSPESMNKVVELMSSEGPEGKVIMDLASGVPVETIPRENLVPVLNKVIGQ